MFFHFSGQERRTITNELLAKPKISGSQPHGSSSENHLEDRICSRQRTNRKVRAVGDGCGDSRAIQGTLFPHLEEELRPLTEREKALVQVVELAELKPIAIIDNNPRRGGQKREMEPARATRFRQRTVCERCNSNLLDNYGGRFVRVRGATKVMTHLVCGVIPITAMGLFGLRR